MNYLLISGNPPAAHFYELWRKEITALQPGAQVRVSPYPLLARIADSSKAMDDVLSTHLGHLHNFAEKIDAPVTLIGHSLGGYFALRLLEQAGNKIQKVILVHPTLRQPHFQGRVILRTLAAFYSFENLQKIILRIRKQLELFSDDLPFVTDEEILKTFHLVKHEDATIGRDRSPVLIRAEHRSKISAFYNSEDIWCHPKVVAALKDQVPVFECEEPHDFITKETHRRSLFAKILRSSSPTEFQS